MYHIWWHFDFGPSNLQSYNKIPYLVDLATQSVVLHFGSPNKHIYLWYLWSCHQRRLNLGSEYRCFESKFQITSPLPHTLHTHTHRHTHRHTHTHTQTCTTHGHTCIWLPWKAGCISLHTSWCCQLLSLLLFPFFSLSLLITCTFHSSSSFPSATLSMEVHGPFFSP